MNDAIGTRAQAFAPLLGALLLGLLAGAPGAAAAGAPAVTAPPVEAPADEAPADEAPAWRLAYRFTPGEVARYRLNITDYELMTAGGREIDRWQRVALEFDQHVEGVDEEGNGLWRQVFTDATWQGRPVPGLIGLESRLRVSPDGRVLESEGLQHVFAEIARLALRSFAAYLPGLDRLPLRIDFSRLPSGQFNPLYQAFSPTFPGEPVRVGDTWTRREDLAGPAGRREAPVHYRLEAVEENLARIVIEPADPRREDGPAEAVSVSGRVDFCLEAGAPLLIGTNMTMTGVDTAINPDHLRFLVDIPAGQPPVPLQGNKKTQFVLRRLPAP